MKEFFSHLGYGRLILLGLCIPLAIVAFLYKFVIPGYSFTALVCLVLICICLFYALIPLVGIHHPELQKWSVRIVSVILVLGLTVCGITEAIIIHASHGDPDRETPYILVLGAKVNDYGPSISLWDRINAAYDYLLDHPDTIAVVSGGKGKDEPISEAQCMYDYLTDWGIHPDRILMEDQASSTWENLHFTLDLLEQTTGQRPTELGILSSEYHLYRASLFAKACDIEFIGIPASTSRFTQRLNYFMREVAGVWHYILLGGQYK